MGLFVLSLGKTWEDNVREAEINLEILRDDKMDPRSGYLLTFAIACLQEAVRKLNEQEAAPEGDR